MKFISYAQNFEDIMLWRALKFYENGFYIDIGANDPSIDSVTRAFYDRNWRGINVEPAPSFFEALKRDRPEDINLNVAVGEHEQLDTFYEVVGTGLSTMYQSTAKEHEDSGREVRQYEVMTQTLTSICDSYVSSEIHFLKIDVEGHEEAVLKGMDFSRYRPWIILIETPFSRDQVWEPILINSSYKPVLFDGLNTFYLANEKANLAGAFESPPSYLDDFLLCHGHNYSYPIEDTSIELATLKEKYQKAELELNELKRSRAWRFTQALKRVIG